MNINNKKLYPELFSRETGWLHQPKPGPDRQSMLEYRQFIRQFYPLKMDLPGFCPRCLGECGRDRHETNAFFCGRCRLTWFPEVVSEVSDPKRIVNRLVKDNTALGLERLKDMPQLKKNTLQGTHEQKDIWDYMANWRNGHLIVRAGAGTGKTTTIVHGLSRMSRNSPCLVLSFTTAVADQMIERLTSVGVGNVHVRTINSFGFSVLRKAFPGIKLRDNKVWWHIREAYGDAVRFETMLAIKNMVELVKSYYLPVPSAETLDVVEMDTAAKVLEEVAIRHMVKLPRDKRARNTQYERVWEICRRCLADTEGCDQDDQLWMPVMLNLQFPQYKLLCIDEVQDVNRTQWEIVRRATGRLATGRVIAVGDHNQACFGFRGADIDAMNRIEKDLIDSKLGSKTFKLTITQRCPKSSVAAANPIVPDLRPLPNAPMGHVGTISEQDFYQKVNPGDMVMSRTNAPLVSAAIQCIVAGKRVVVRGRDVGRSAVRLIEALSPSSIPDLREQLKHWYALQKQQLSYATQQAELASLEDRYKTVDTLAANSSNLAQLHTYIDILFQTQDTDTVPQDSILFSTIHRAKGLEAEVCYILAPQDIPHEKAVMDWEIQQERNLAHIAITRAKFDRAIPTSGRTYFVGGPVPAIYGSGYIRTMKTGKYPPPPAENAEIDFGDTE